MIGIGDTLPSTYCILWQRLDTIWMVATLCMTETRYHMNGWYSLTLCMTETRYHMDGCYSLTLCMTETRYHMDGCYSLTLCVGSCCWPGHDIGWGLSWGSRGCLEYDSLRAVTWPSRQVTWPIIWPCSVTWSLCQDPVYRGSCEVPLGHRGLGTGGDHPILCITTPKWRVSWSVGISTSYSGKELSRDWEVKS